MIKVNSLDTLSNFIGGEWVKPLGGKYIDNYEPATGKVYSKLPDSGVEDAQAAVDAASKAFLSWSKTTVQARSEILFKIANLIEFHKEELALAESRDQGKPVWLALSVDIARAAANFRFFASQILHLDSAAHEMDGVAINFTLRKPIGVAALISPWNLPLYLLTWKIAPAIASGNTCVCKPSEVTSMSAYLLAGILIEAGLPPGVVNIIFGYGHRAGDALVKHPKVPLISFTGGTVTGKRIYEAAAPYVKKLSLELGGKNANIIFADANFEEAVATSLRSSFLNQGEICLCGSRIFVEESIYEKFLSRFVQEVKKLEVGNPREQNSFMGALVSKEHLAKVKSYVSLAKEEGGTVETGEEDLHLSAACAEGYFMRPTILTGLAPTCRVMTEEIFGPVVTVTPFKTEEEVIGFANGVEYGLSASVWSQDISRAHRMARSLDVGTLWINTWMMRDLRVPFGGVKMSGLGREGGTHSLEFYTDATNICIRI